MGVGLHQETSLSPYLLAMIRDVLACGEKDLSPWCMLCADDIVVCSTGREEVENKLGEWRRAKEYGGLKINRKKTVYLKFNGGGNLDENSYYYINLQGENLERVHTFKYLGATMASRWTELGMKELEGQRRWEKYRRKCIIVG